MREQSRSRARGVAQKNEVFLDVTESMSLLVNSNGQVVHSEVTGALKMRCYLSGMPECKLGLNDKMMMEAQGKGGKGKAVELEDMKFHQCVRLSRFDADRTVSFIPPDGAFDLMTYRLSTAVKPLFWVEAVVEKHGTSRVEYMVKIRSQFKEKSSAQGVVVKLPVSSDATNPIIRTNAGSAEYAPEQEALLWKIKAFPGGKEYLLRAKFALPSVSADEETGAKVKRPPIKVSFEIPYFTVSGIQVRYLKVSEKSGYQALPWVRYISKSGASCSVRPVPCTCLTYAIPNQPLTTTSDSQIERERERDKRAASSLSLRRGERAKQRARTHGIQTHAAVVVLCCANTELLARVLVVEAHDGLPLQLQQLAHPEDHLWSVNVRLPPAAA